MTTTKTSFTCVECGSDAVWQDASWYPNDDHTNTFDMAYCEKCEGETNLVGEVPEPGWSHIQYARYTKDLEDMLRRVVDAIDQSQTTVVLYAIVTEAKALLERTGYTEDF